MTLGPAEREPPCPVSRGGGVPTAWDSVQTSASITRSPVGRFFPQRNRASRAACGVLRPIGAGAKEDVSSLATVVSLGDFYEARHVISMWAT